eukprot:4436505-Amphidinium_carterae.1
MVFKQLWKFTLISLAPYQKCSITLIGSCFLYADEPSTSFECHARHNQLGILRAPMGLCSLCAGDGNRSALSRRARRAVGPVRVVATSKALSCSVK